jgi:hypothetical protein
VLKKRTIEVYVKDILLPTNGIPRGKYEIDLTKAVYMPAFTIINVMNNLLNYIISNLITHYRRYYPLPKYVGALKVVELDTEVDNFHV